MEATANGRRVRLGRRPCRDIVLTASMSQPESPETPPPHSLQGLTREQKMALLHDELIKLNAQLEYLRLMLKLRCNRCF
jgi:hypothetical protein